MDALQGRLPDGPANETVARARIAVLPVVVMMLVTAVLTVIAIAISVEQQKEIEVARLQAIANLKATQIAHWLDERVDDARILRRSENFLEDYYQWRDSGSVASRERIQNRLSAFSTLERYSGVLLLDDRGDVVLHTPGLEPWKDGGHVAALREVIQNGKPAHLGPYLDDKGMIHFDLVVPIDAMQGHPGFAVVLNSSSASFPPTDLLAWPIPTASGEVVLFRRDGEDILFLNELKYRTDSAVRLRMPLSDSQLMASRFLQLPEAGNGLVEGLDYRAEAVFAVGKRIDGTDWYLLAKMDWSELYGLSKRDALWIALAGVLLFFMMLTGLFLYHQRGAIARVKAMQREQDGRLQSLKLFSTVADSSSDAIFAKDLEGRYLLFNHAAERVTGKAVQDVLGRTDATVFPAAQARQIMANDQKVMREGRVFTYEEAFDTPFGAFVFLAVKGPLYGDKGKIIGMYGISRDITERKTFEDALSRSNEELKRFNLAMVGRELDMIRLKDEVNTLAAALGRPEPYSLAMFKAGSDAQEMPDASAGAQS
ncbi:MAG: hypothetical protein CVV18_03080 [Gammaproteobacteria bacterium HGW-Gammaproteobacteria-8]|jgi:PAS domain S-box-containing protein|nr:MAG: hypothetical protein CVV18_03080 [Gammaproteobacteria bacterium HGW-Gammaproteobacteria-8]